MQSVLSPLSKMTDTAEGNAQVDSGQNTVAHSHISIFNEGSDSHHVDVARAEEQFNELSRQLTIRSTHSLTDSTATANDVEKGGSECFDLREYLTSSNDANQRAGIKHKVRRVLQYTCISK